MEVHTLAEQWVRIPSVTGDERAICERVERDARAHNIACRRVEVDATRWDLVLGCEQPRVWLSTHLDTVPGGPTCRVEDGRLLGRGSCDAKGIAAAMFMALLDLRQRGVDDVGLLLVVGEETCSDGAKAAAAELAPADFLVNGEPTELTYVRAQRGALALVLDAEGRSCHSGYPEQGRSALHALLDVVADLRRQTWPQDPQLGETLINVGRLRGGRAANVLADLAEAEIMLRPSVPVSPVERQVVATIGGRVRMSVRTRSEPQFFHVPADQESVVAGFASDVAHLRGLGQPLMIGPGSILDAHTDGEHVELADLQRAKEIYVQLGQTLGREQP